MPKLSTLGFQMKNIGKKIFGTLSWDSPAWLKKILEKIKFQLKNKYDAKYKYD